MAAAETPLGVLPDDQTSTLFAFEARRSGRIITRLVAVEADTHRIRVAAEIYPVDVPETTEPQRRFYDFPTRHKARGFADEALLALEYLGCTITEISTDGGTSGPAERAA